MQGIAALPSGMAPEGAAEQPAVGSLSAQEAATLGRLLTKVSQDEIDQLRELTEDLKEFTLPELKDFLGGVDYIMQNAQNYKQSVRNLIARGIVEPGDLPADYVPTFYSILRQMLMTAIQQEEAPQQFAKGGLVDMAKKVAKAGRHGDTMLAHITPREAAMLKAAGGAGTINPATGLVEYKSFWSKAGSFLKKAAPVILPIALNFVVPGLGAAVGGALGVSAAAGSAIVGAVGSGVGGLIAGQKPAQALLSAALGGLGSYAAATLAPSGISGLLSGGGTGAEGAASGIGPGSGLEGAPEIVSGTAPAAAGSIRPDVPVPNSRAALMAGGPEAFVNNQPYAASPAAVAANTPVSGGLGTLFGGGDGAGSTIGNALKNPWMLAGLAGAAGLAFGGKGGEQAKPSLVQGPTGSQLLQQNPAQYGFNIANFQAQPVGPVRTVPTLSPAYGSYPRYAAAGGHISGPGTGTSDDVPAMLSDGEFVLTAKAVRGAGNGSRKEGAKKLYKLMNDLEKRA